LQLDLKTTGWGPFHSPTARRLELFSDWIEAQAYLLGSSLSQNELVDRLENTALVKDSDDAWSLVGNAFASCRSRRKLMGASYPFALAGDHIELADETKLAYLFCLFASLPEQLKKLRTDYPADFRDIFEAVAAESLRRSMPHWTVYETGWSVAADEGKNAIVQNVVNWTRAKHYDPTVFPNANDAQVDIALVRAFADERSAFPIILGQCATGVTDWKSKAARPNLDRWSLAVQFSSNPLKMFAVPFALDDESFWEATVECKGLVLDRSRICAPLDMLTGQLEQKVRQWLADIKPVLPLAA
jgi:hypothetical protein